MELKWDWKCTMQTMWQRFLPKALKKGGEIEVRDQEGHAQTLTVLDAIPYGHKVAIEDIQRTR